MSPRREPRAPPSIAGPADHHDVRPLAPNRRNLLNGGTEWLSAIRTNRPLSVFVNQEHTLPLLSLPRLRRMVFRAAHAPVAAPQVLARSPHACLRLRCAWLIHFLSYSYLITPLNAALGQHSRRRIAPDSWRSLVLTIRSSGRFPPGKCTAAGDSGAERGREAGQLRDCGTAGPGWDGRGLARPRCRAEALRGPQRCCLPAWREIRTASLVSSGRPAPARAFQAPIYRNADVPSNFTSACARQYQQ